MGMLATASLLVLVGAGCAAPVVPEQKETPSAAVKTEEKDTSGETLSEQAEIVINAALEEAGLEEDDAGDVAEDDSLFTADEQDLNTLEQTYDENEL